MPDVTIETAHMNGGDFHHEDTHKLNAVIQSVAEARITPIATDQMNGGGGMNSGPLSPIKPMPVEREKGGLGLSDAILISPEKVNILVPYYV